MNQPTIQPTIVSKKNNTKKWLIAGGCTATALCAGLVVVLIPVIFILINNSKPAEQASAPISFTPEPVEPVQEIPILTDTPMPLLPTLTPLPTATEYGPPADPYSLPRHETVYFAGIQWGSVAGWNPYSNSNNNVLAMKTGSNPHEVFFETPYMYNMIDGKLYPLLADGGYSWNSNMTELTFKIKPAAHWSDGSPVTAYDVAYTWTTHVVYDTYTAYQFSELIDSVIAADQSTVIIKAALDSSGKPVNPLMLLEYICSQYVAQKEWTQKLEARSNWNSGTLLYDPAEDTIASGPYLRYYSGDDRVVLLRDDNYWGQDASLWGRLPGPRYLAHLLYEDNEESNNAFFNGEVDVSQVYIEYVSDLWLQKGLAVSTYLDGAPYSVGASMPSAFYNLNSYGLDQAAVRKAIAIAIDYDAMITNAMTNQSANFIQMPRSLMNATPAEQGLFDHTAVAGLQWAGNDIRGAKALLDTAGIVDTNGDGYREFNGTTLRYNAVCPDGWFDWMAAIELIAQAGQKIGIDITVYYPDWGEYQQVFTNGNQDEYDIFMVWTTASGPSNPWARARMLMSSEYVGRENNWDGNWGGYANPRVDELLRLIPQETDQAKLISYYTELTEIYLTDIPSFTLFYRPEVFHTVNESVWQNYPTAIDGLVIPPLNLLGGYGIAGLYIIQPVNP